ncbi:EAL domain-containing protein [Denitromonas iodatirespirans]|uniref:EAL domain-containing protein n=1 Tax=Denitromonas iodatirespirans TaxID=2795389 RepID=A0A944DB74_DENI1|nr:EAL domain-containing protein [Denitromonas iodatirespirans]MBT0963110.1 EAL domain-containing protein [Denitromonas iodatirespirans]
MIRCCLFLLACLALPAYPAQAAPLDADSATPRVLGIFFGQRDPPYEILLERGLREGFDGHDKAPRIALDTVYLDMQPGYDPARARLIAQTLKLKYGDSPPFDLLILSGATSVRFQQEVGRWLGRGPVVQVEGIFVDQPIPTDGNGRITLRNARAIAETARDALAILPDSQALWVIGGSARDDAAVMAAARTQLVPLAQHIDVRFIEVGALDALLSDVRHAPDNTLLLYLRVSRDGAGRPVMPVDVAARIGREANAPMFCIYEIMLLRSDCVGGNVSAGPHTGMAVATTARRLLAGDAPLPAVQMLPTRPRYNWPQLERWQVARSTLPAHAELIDYTPSLYERHRPQVLGGILILAVLALALLGMLWALSLYRKQRDTVSELERRWHLALESAGQGVWDLDMRSGEAFYADGWLAMLGLDQVPNDPRVRDERIHPGDRAEVAQRLQQHLGGELDHFESEHRMLRHDGHVIWVRERGQVVRRDARGQALRFIASMQDITDQHTAQDHIRHLATHDSLTGLPNRTLLTDRLENAIGRARRAGTRVAVIFLDLDHFKTINDTLGHPVGDLLLIAVAGRLMPHLRETDTICRQGGDEFVILLPDLHAPGDAAQVCEKLQRELDEPVNLDGRDLRISVSMGVALFPEDGDSADRLLQKADVALYQVKNDGRGDYRFFSPDMNRELEDQFALESQLGAALRDGRIRMWFQPQFDLSSGALVGAEALARWIETDGRMIPPDTFIPVVEKFGHVHRLGELALRSACQHAVRWAEAGGRPVPVAVNLSSVQFRRPGLTELVRTVLSDTGLPPAHLILEITESVLMEDNITARETLAGLAGLGVGLSVDDFGTGYSSLAYLKRFPVNHLKIDRAFVMDLGCDPDSDVLVRTIVQLGHNLNLQVIAEGVENEVQADRLREYGCDIGQGYLYHPAMAPEHFLQLLHRG